MKFENDGYEPTPYDRILGGIHVPAREADETQEVFAAEAEAAEVEEIAGKEEIFAFEEEESLSQIDDEAQDYKLETISMEELNQPVLAASIEENAGEISSTDNFNRLSQIGDDKLVYTTLEFTEADDEKVVRVYVEEDILVPDIKPDMASILSMDGSVRCSDREIKTGLKAEDGINVSGDITLKTIYIPENKGINSVVTIQSRVPFRADEALRVPALARMSLNPVIEKIEYSVVNERKFRAKLTIAVHAKEYLKKSMSFFEGIDGEEIQLLKEKVTFTDVMVKKSEAIDLKETIALKDGMPEPDQILKFDVRTVENHKQITQDRAVINASVYYSILYLAKPQEVEGSAGEAVSSANNSGNPASGAGSLSPDTVSAAAANGTEIVNAPYMCQGKIDFTHFLSMPGTSGQSGSRVTFDDSDITIKITGAEQAKNYDGYEKEDLYGDAFDDDADGFAAGAGSAGAGKAAFVLEGSVGTSIEVYKNIEGEAATDVYHNEKELVYESEEFACSALEGSGVVEIPVREIVNVPAEYGDIDRVIYVSGKLIENEAQAEYGKEIVSGVLQAELLAIPEDKEQRPFKLTREIQFRGSMDIMAARSGMLAESDMYIRELRCDKINDKQVEINAGVFVSGTVYSRSVQRLVKNPAFVESDSGTERKAGIILYITKPQEDLWSIAKKFRTTMAKIRSVNEMAGEANDRSVPEGSRLLIIK